MRTEYDEHTSIPGLIKGLLDDARDLVREELQLARAEIREEISAVQSATIAFAISAVVAVFGGMLLTVALGSAVAYFLHWPPWAGYGVVGLLLLAAGYGACLYARARLRQIRVIPNTTDSMKENLTWIQNRSGRR